MARIQSFVIRSKNHKYNQNKHEDLQVEKNRNLWQHIVIFVNDLANKKEFSQVKPHLMFKLDIHTYGRSQIDNRLAKHASNGQETLHCPSAVPVQ